MTILKKGSTGKEVVALQELLARRGFPPGLPDGKFGPGTDAAVRAFQRSEGLVADGEVGSVTLAALRGLPPPPRDDTAMFTVEVVRAMFPKTLVRNIKANLPGVLDAMRAAGIGDRVSLLMALATIRAETEQFLPVTEAVSKYNTSPGGKPFDLYDNRRDLGNKGVPDGSRYPGRGYVQLTGASNYARIGKAIGFDLAGKPELANDPVVAGKVLAEFLRARIVEIKNALVAGDLRSARRIVNGGSHGLDRFEEAYRAGDAATGGGK